jgi:hypothetical protein
LQKFEGVWPRPEGTRPSRMLTSTTKPLKNNSFQTYQPIANNFALGITGLLQVYHNDA